MEAMKHWEDNTCVRFHLRTTQKNYIHFLAGSVGSESDVGIFHLLNTIVDTVEIGYYTIRFMDY